jgi:hypothetical protein
MPLSVPKSLAHKLDEALEELNRWMKENPAKSAAAIFTINKAYDFVVAELKKDGITPTKHDDVKTVPEGHHLWVPKGLSS